MMLKALYEAQLAGRAVCDGDIARIPEAVIRDENKRSRNGYSAALQIRQAMKRYCTCIRAPLGLSNNQQDELEAFNELLESLSVVSSRVCDQRVAEGGENQQDLEFSRAFYEASGWEPLLRFVKDDAIPTLTEKRGLPWQRRSCVIDVAVRGMLILKDLCMNVPELGEALGAQDDLIVLFIRALTIKPLYEMAGLLCEELLVGRRDEVFDLRKIQDFPGLIRSMNACQLLLFCRLVSLIALNPEERAANNDGKHLTSFELLDQRRAAAVVELSGGDLVTFNHLQLVSIAQEFLPRLVQLLDDASSRDAEKKLWLGKDAKYWRSVDPSVFVDDPLTASISDSSSLSSRIHSEHPEALPSSLVTAMGTTPRPTNRKSVSKLALSTCRNWALFGARLVLHAVNRLRSSVIRFGPHPSRATDSTSGDVSVGVWTMVKSFMRSLLPLGSPSANDHSPSTLSQQEAPSQEAEQNTNDADLGTENGPAEEIVDYFAGALLGEEDDIGAEEEEDEDLAIEEEEGEEDTFGEYILNPHFWANGAQRDLWLISQRLEIAYVLCTLCIGPFRKAAQNVLGKLDLIKALTVRFDSLPWDPSLNPANLPPSVRLHGSGCECNAHGAFKAQLLRLVHNFCDRESPNWENKSKMFSDDELHSLEWDFDKEPAATMPFGWGEIAVKFPRPFALSETENDQVSRQVLEMDALTRLNTLGLPGDIQARHGLAWRIAAVQVASGRSEHDPSLRFWVYAALESLLRGSPANMKMMICSWGVLKAVVNDIITQASQSANGNGQNEVGVLQTSFDLLGELVKDNPVGLGWLCGASTSVLGPFIAEDTLEQVCEIALQHLVDGNVFLRAVALTVHRNPNDDRLHRAEEWILQRNAVKLSAGLVQVVAVDDLSQENLCCLNTAVVLLSFARWDGKLEDFVSGICDYDVSSCRMEFTQQLLQSNDSIRVRFRKLLWFWRCYYSCRTIDRNSLQFSSGLLFTDLEETVSEICSLDRPEGSMLSGKDKIHVPYLGNSLPVTTQVPLKPWTLC